MRCFECGATTHLRHNCPQFLGKAAAKPQASVNRVSACGYYVEDSAPKQHSPVASVCEQIKNSDYNIASLFGYALPSDENGKDGSIDSVILCRLLLRHMCDCVVCHC